MSLPVMGCHDAEEEEEDPWRIVSRSRQDQYKYKLLAVRFDF